MYIEIKDSIKYMTEIVTRTRTDMADYQKDMCMLAYIIGKIQGQIDSFENNKESNAIKAEA